MNTERERLSAALANFQNAGPASEEEISEAESTLGLLFPNSYRIFLELFGASMGPGFEVYGLGATDLNSDSPPLWVDVIESTMRLRPQSLPKNSIQISHDGVEIGFFLECSECDREFDSNIIEWGAPHDGVYATNLSFIEFVEQRANFQ